MRFYLVWNLLSVRVTAWLASRQRSEGREGGGGERQQQVRSATVRVLSSSQQQTNINTKQGLSWLPRSRIWSTPPPPPPAPTSTGKPFGQFLSILIKPCRTTSDPALSVQHWQLYQTPSCLLIMFEILPKYFSGLSSEEKREEVMRLLPAITSFERNFNEVRDEIDASLNRLERANLIKRWGGFFNDNFVGWSLYPQV